MIYVAKYEPFWISESPLFWDMFKPAPNRNNQFQFVGELWWRAIIFNLRVTSFQTLSYHIKDQDRSQKENMFNQKKTHFL